LLKLSLASVTVISCLSSSLGFAKSVSGQSLDSSSVGLPTQHTEASEWVFFAGSRMTTNRAEGMLNSTNMELVGFEKCESTNHDCVALSVERKNGNIFQYFLIDKPCYTVTKSGVSQVATRDIKQASSIQLSNKHESTKNLDTETEAQKKPRDFCISGYKVASRIKQDYITSVTPDGHLVKLSHLVQDPADDQWKDVATMSISNWIESFVTPPSGAIEGWSYELLDQDGAIIAGDHSEWSATAGSSNSTVSDEARCKARVDRISKDHIWIAQPLLKTSCGLFWPTTVNVVVADFNTDYCGAVDQSTTRGKQALSSALLDKCFENPEKFLATDNPSKLLITNDDVEDIQFQTPWVLEGLVPADCSSFTARNVDVDMGDGMICTADIRYECSEKTTGVCECEEGAMASDLACTGGDR